MLCLGVVFAGFAAYVLFADNQPRDEVVNVIVQPQETMGQLQQGIRDEQVVRNPKTFEWTCRLMRFNTPKTGKYKLPAHANNVQMVRMLRRGQHYPVSFTFNNVRTIDQFVKKVSDKFYFEPEELSTLLQDTTFLGQYGLTAQTLPAVFLPNSYQIYYDITAQDFFERMYKEYQRFWTKERLALADSIGLTPVEVSTLASIVEEENRRPAEKAIIAGLYMNRLHKDMLLQSDPTVKFALGDFTRQRILNADLQVDSPYNTYKYRGLPPGPIRIPEASTLDSVLHYRHHDYLYMCAKEDFSGYHNFTASSAVHAQNAARYRAALNKRNIKR